jgi:Spy/CpxP family protein refolding chaperone
MKKLFLLLVVAAMAVTSAVAQEPKEPTPAPQKEVKPTEQKDVKTPDQMKQDRAAWEKKFKEDLKLTPEQSDKYDALNKEYSEKIEAIAKDATLDQAAQKEKKMGLKKEKEAKLLEILTTEQQAKFKELKESMEKKNAPTKEQ